MLPTESEHIPYGLARSEPETIQQTGRVRRGGDSKAHVVPVDQQAEQRGSFRVCAFADQAVDPQTTPGVDTVDMDTPRS